MLALLVLDRLPRHAKPHFYYTSTSSSAELLSRCGILQMHFSFEARLG